MLLIKGRLHSMTTTPYPLSVTLSDLAETESPGGSDMLYCTYLPFLV